MAYRKGHKKIEGSGMQKGQKTKKTQQWEHFSEFMLNEGLSEVQVRMSSLSDRDYIQVVNQFMEYFKPKKARTEITGKDGKELLPIPIIDVSKNNSDKEGDGDEKKD